MIDFRVFGSLDLRRSDGHELRSVLAQPKRLALLAYLAVATPRGFHRRDKLLPLFWPEADQEHARGSLRKAIHVLRHALGEGALLSRGDEEIGLASGELWCDAAAFEQALDTGAAEQALALYRGDLLSGLHLSHSPEFDRWLEAERGRLRQRARGAARELARLEERNGNEAKATYWYRRALALFPDDESDLQALVRLLDGSGDRAGALREYDLFARRLADELEVEPSPESRALIEKIRARAGHRTSGASLPKVEERGPRTFAEPAEPNTRSRWLIAGGAGVLTVLAVTAALLGLNGRGDPKALDRRVVAVVPFRVTGADPFLAFLREGMIDLLAAKLGGTDDLRTVDSRTLLIWWQRAGGSEARDLDRPEALALVSRLGAGRLLEGQVTGTARQLTLAALLTDVNDGTEIRASVEGPYDSLSSSIDRLAAELLALGAGEPRHRLAALTSTSLPALREYLEGRSALRRGAYPDAVRHFDRALEIDSTFAVAGLGRTNAAIWVGEGQLGPGSLRAWPYRERLAARDRATLRFMLGPNYPYRSTEKEWFAAAEDVVKVSPDDSQAWATIGDQMYHYGGLLGIPRALERSLAAYDRALALDSTYLPGWEHLAVIALLAGDSAQARRVIRLRLQRDSISSYAKEDLWLGLKVLGDTGLPSLPLSDDSLVSQPNGVAWKAVALGAALADADTVVELMLARVQGKTDRKRAEVRARNFYLIRGWPSRARRAVDATLSTADARKDFLILDAIYADGDPVLAKRLVGEVPRDYARPASDEEFLKVILQCVAAQFELAQGNTEPARRAVRAWLLKPMMPETLVTAYTTHYAARLLDTQLAAVDRRPDARARLEELDSLLQSAPTGGDFIERIGNIEVARIWHQQGEPERALRSIRRRLEGLQTYSELPRYLRDEGRYAALVGDRDGAIRAYRQYLLLRTEAEPSLQYQVDTVRTELHALERKSGAAASKVGSNCRSAALPVSC